ncbi:MAG: RluA family pseudouridine synthase [Proteobacteria bacterium]|nr:RluA family pseudouridine synthase [Pseudomonadota bacterium]
MKRGGKGGPRQPGGGKQTAGPRKGGRPPQGRGGRKDRFGGRNENARFVDDERGPRGKFGGERSGRPRAKYGKRDEQHSARHPEVRTPRSSGAKRAPSSRARGEGWGEGASRHVEPNRYSPILDQAERSEKEAISPALLAATKVQTVTVTPDENGMRVDRFFEARFPGLSFSHIQRIVRKGEVRVNGKRIETKSRLEAGQQVRIPPLQLAAPRVREDSPQVLKDRDYLHSITLAEDDDVLILNKPMGLAVQGGSGTTRHVDGLLEALRGPGRDAQKPRLVHRLDKDTAGCLLIAKTRFAAAALAKTFRTRSARKIYWALVAGVPKPKQGRISTYLAKQEMEEDSFMRVAKHGEKDAVHAVTYYAVVETSAQKLAWISLKPVTGRTHQLRAHMAHIGHPIVGDPKYFNIENWELPGGIQNKLHLLARRIVVPHPRGGTIDVSAPLPPHMQQSWNLLGLDAERFDPIVDAPDED